MDEHNPEHLGLQQEPENHHGITRAQTTGQLRSWIIPRTGKALEILSEEVGKYQFPGLYILFAEGQKKVYIGEATNLYERIKQHTANPDSKIKDWRTAYTITDGRPPSLSLLNDTVVRKTLEYYLITLFKANKYNVVSQGAQPPQSSYQKHLSESLMEELNFFLIQKGVIQKLIETGGQEQVFGDELQRLLTRNGHHISQWGAYDAIVDGNNAFIRPGSDKRPKGWQITFRDRFLDGLQRGDGFLLIARDAVPFVPLKEVQKVITDESAYDQNTIDVYITFEEEKVTLRYQENAIDITKFKLRS